MTRQDALNIALRKAHAGQLSEAEADYRRLIAQQPSFVEAHSDLGTLLCMMGRYREAVKCYLTAIATNPTYAGGYDNLGNALRLLGDIRGARDAHQKAWSLAPRSAGTMFNLGLDFHDLGQIEEAIDLFRRATAAQPDHVLAQFNLGCCLEKSGRRAEAIAAFEKTVALQPNYAAAHCNLGGLLFYGSRIDESLAHCRRAIELDPLMAEGHANFGNALWQAGRTQEAIASFRRSAELAPNNSGFLGNCSYTSYFDLTATLDDRKRIHEQWNRRFAEPLKDSIPRHENDRRPDRPLRVGYVSPNFTDHAEGAFIVPLLENHDPAAIELYCYSDVARPDYATERIRRRANVWRQTVGLSDAELAARIHDDRIDILIDLTMHMNGSRLQVFARKPAPIQIAYLAYPGTTGLPTMDYRITDAFVDPPGIFEGHYTEACIRLPRTFACCNPALYLDSTAPAVDQLSQLSIREAQSLTFGSLNAFAKVNTGVLERWSRVLREVPDSRLRLLAPAEEGRLKVLEQLAGLGVESNRIDFVGKQKRADYLAEYLCIDICLDTLPYCGHTTTLDALWMGTPVVTRVGTTAAGRVGWSVLKNLGLTELAAKEDDEFVRIAVELAADAPRRRQLHAKLRQRLTDSPLMDGAAFARDVEAAYRRVWHDWIAR